MKLEALIHWYEQLTPASLGEVDQLYHEGALFRDPFNDVQGQPAIKAIFRHMFNTTENPRFEVTDRQTDGNIAWLRWIFECRMRGRQISIEGASRVVFGEDGRVVEHRDYWDSTDLFLQLPLLGTMVNVLKQRMSVPASGQGGENYSNAR
jgi:ketosteroid isomerase-like protein